MNQNKLFLPISVIIAGLIIAGAIVFTNKKDAAPAPVVNNGNQAPELTVKPVDPKTDHIKGDANAEVVIIEYSDFECPYCASFHPTMERIFSEYGAQGKVAWVYRHFPLRSIHPNAQAVAEASECVANLGDNDKFWSFSKKVFDGRLAIMPLLQKGASRTAEDNAKIAAALAPETLSTYASDLGVDKAAFDSCVTDHTYASRVDADYQDGSIIAQADQNFGTPYSIVMKDGEVVTTIGGAQPYTMVKQIIDTVLAQ